MPIPTLADVLSQVHGYENLAFRIALRRDPQGGWLFHTLVLDAIPASYTRDTAAFQERYNLERYAHLYTPAVFIAGVQDSVQILSWFNTAQDFSIPAPTGPGTSTRVFTARMPALQEQPLVQQYYYRTAETYGYDRMRWPHTLYRFTPRPPLTDQYDNTSLVPQGRSGSRTFPDFKSALVHLVYGIRDPNRAQGHDTSPGVTVRIVKDQPFFFDVELRDERVIAVDVRGRATSDTFIQLDIPDRDIEERVVDAPNTYLFAMEDLPLIGSLVLIHSGEILDKYEWNMQFPLPGAPGIATGRPLLPFSPEIPGIPGELRTLMNLGEIAGVSLPAPAAPDESDEDVPTAIRASLARFRADHPDPQKVGFIMMRFGATSAHNGIVQAIKKSLSGYGLEALRADDKEYHENTYENIQTYMHGCGFGIAVFERLESDQFNPNVAFEVGYMKALKKPVCLLKDTTLTALHTDLLGKLYRPFDHQQIQKTIRRELEKWLRDNDLL